MIVPYSAGGGTDQVARFIGKTTEKYLNQPINVINKTGAGGAVGMTAGAKAKANGYNVTMVTVELSILPHLGGMKVDYSDFKPLLQLNSSPAAITVRADSKFNTLNDLIEYAKKNPGTVKIGNSGVGSIWHLAAMELNKEAGVQLTPIPYDGAATAIATLLGNHIEAVSVSVQEVQSQVEAGTLKILGIMNDERLPEFKDVPTLKELGYDINIGTWRALAVPVKTPEDRVKVLEDAFVKGVQDKEFIELMNKAGLSINLLSSKEFEEKLEKENEDFKELVKLFK